MITFNTEQDFRKAVLEILQEELSVSLEKEYSSWEGPSLKVEIAIGERTIYDAISL